MRGAFDWDELDKQREAEAAAQRRRLLGGMSASAILLLSVAGYLHIMRPDPPGTIARLDSSAQIESAAQDAPRLPEQKAEAFEPLPGPLETVTRAPFDVEPFSETEASGRYELSNVAPCVRDLQRLALGTTLYFELSSIILTVDQLEKARSIGQALTDCPEAALQLWGHADGSGNDLENMKLSRDRAQNLLAAFSAMGFDTERMDAVAFGATRSAEAGDFSKDRRVEFRVIPSPNR